jgi:probable 2-oxoglutarate dehydrogenase E1 component DHKTD1
VAYASRVAFAYRHAFRKDVIIDLIAYRRMGHNELDEPAFTQPKMYQTIRGRKSVPRVYESTLLEKGVVKVEEIEAVRSEWTERLERSLKESYEYKPVVSDCVFFARLFALHLSGLLNYRLIQ